MALTDQIKVLEHNGLSADLALKVFQYQDEAENLLRQWIGDSKYEEVEANTSHAYYTKVQKAESLLCYAYALPVLNMRVTEKGGVVKMIGLDQMGNANMLMGKRELDSYVRNLIARSRKLVRKLILASTNTDRPEYQRDLARLP